MSDALAIPMFSDGTVPMDTAPETTHELVCATCGKELEYSGRGRKPRFCDEHKRSSSGTSKVARSSGKNETMAAQAATVLSQFNGLIAIGLMMTGLPLTAQALETAKDAFREQAYNALLTDPDLCKLILKGGTGSGKVALAIAYGMLGTSVVPVGIMEFQSRREAARKAVDDDVQ